MTVTTIALPLPSDVVAALRSRPGVAYGIEEQLKVSLAIGLFAEGRISLAKAASLAGRTRYEFAHLLQGINLAAYDYSEDEFAEDAAFRAAMTE